MGDTFDVNMHNSDTFEMDLKSDIFDINLDETIKTDLFQINMTKEDVLNTEMKSEEQLNVELLEGIPIGMDDYEVLRNLPKINGITLLGDKTFEQLGRNKITNQEIKNIIDEQYELIFGGGNNG